MKRVTGWQERFWKTLMDLREAPFEWGRHDCVLFAARMIDAVTGAGIFERIRERYPYTDAATAARIIAENIGLCELVTYELREDPVRPAQCHWGDVLLSDLGGRKTLVVHDGSLLVGPGPNRLEAVHLTRATCGWRVG